MTDADLLIIEKGFDSMQGGVCCVFCCVLIRCKGGLLCFPNET
jgi:hypothetical protein